MLVCSQEIISAIESGAKPQTVLRIIHRGGQYLWSDRDIPGIDEPAPEAPRFDGTRSFDGTWSFGIRPAILDAGRKVSKWARLRKSLTTSGSGLRTGLKQSDVDNITLELLPEAPASPALRGARAELVAIWPGIAVDDGLVLFRGEVSQVKRSREKITLKLAGVGAGLSDTLEQPVRLRKASAYASPRNDSALLPLVYGDLTVGGTGGQYKAICLDTGIHVYALAGHPIQAIADGGKVEIYDRDDQLINASNYTLNLSHDFQGKGIIATATFADDVSDLEPLGVAARGKADEDGELMENPVDVGRDLLLMHTTVAEQDLHPASWAQARALCASMGYEAGRAIVRQHRAGDLLWGLLYTNFSTLWWIDGQGQLQLLTDGGAGYIPRDSIVGHIDARYMADASGDCQTKDICNQLSVDYAPNLISGDWQGFDDGEGSRDALSQERHGLRTWELELAWIRRRQVANARQEVLVSRYAGGGELFKVPVAGCGLIRLERGDHPTVSAGPWLKDDDGLALSHQIMRVETVQFDPATGGMELSVRDTGYFRTQSRQFDGSWSLNGQGRFGGERYQEAA